MKVSQKPLPAGRQAKISVIMSVYNGMPYLAEAVRSILNQTYKNFEFIIVDDASTDGTWKYLNSIKDGRIKLIRNSKNLGLAASLNKALKSAGGEYIARMDADDISLPRRLEAQLEFMQENPDVDLCGTWAYLINESSEIIGEKKFYEQDQMIKRALAIYSPIIHPTYFAKKDFFTMLGGYNRKFEYAEDYELLLRARRDFKFANIPIKLFKWRLWDRRRSRAEMEKIDRADFRVKLTGFKKGYFGKPYLSIVILKFFVTFLTPYFLKKAVAKKIKLA